MRLWFLPESDVLVYVWSVDQRYDSLYLTIAESMDVTEYKQRIREEEERRNRDLGTGTTTGTRTRVTTRTTMTDATAGGLRDGRRRAARTRTRDAPGGYVPSNTSQDTPSGG